MSYRTTSNKGILSRLKARNSALQAGLLAVAICWPHGSAAEAKTRTLPSHGKIKLDSYNYLLRDVHPASQAQANYLQNRLFLTGLKKAERLERQERLDVYGERLFIDKLEGYQNAANLLSAGRPTSARGLATFWVLVSVFGDQTEVYDALSLEVPPMSHDDFMPTSLFIRILRPDGELAPLPTLLEAINGPSASPIQLAWSTVLKELRATERLSAQNVAAFSKAVAEYRLRCVRAIPADARDGRFEAETYLKSLGVLAAALYRPHQFDQIRRYVEGGGYAYHGNSMLGLVTHMLQHRVTPAQGSAAQMALAEVARPISRVLEQEIALRYERIDSLAANEGHRPYAAEYRRHDDPTSAMPNMGISNWTP
jgi:hypothetical protein